LAANGIYAVLKLTLTEDPPTISQLIITNVYGAIIFIPSFSLYFGLQFLRRWRLSALESEKFQKETMHSRLQSLKSHLDPHFLFNNLNILSSLIENDPEKSREFLQTFSEVYRMILQSRNEDLIPVSKEIHFLEKYFFLLETRFGDCIRLEIVLEEPQLKSWIPPLTLQMLLENAMKHNRISETKPLEIKIYGTDSEIIVSNSLHPKPIPATESSGTGIDNIRKRYAYFHPEPVRVFTRPDNFAIRLPILSK
jgi:LytS/YehU family sensor histidine kinase